MAGCCFNRRFWPILVDAGSYFDLHVRFLIAGSLELAGQRAMCEKTRPSPEKLREQVKSVVAEIVGMEDLVDDTPLMQAGLTSQSAVLLRNALSKEIPGASRTPKMQAFPVAMAALNRWTAQKRDIEMQKNMGKATYMGGALPDTAAYGPYKRDKRPKIASEVKTVKECEHWRQDILRGVAKKIAEIQNAALGEHRIRDLNDEINKDLREKGYWEDQIKALGGADYKSQPKRDVETYGAELASHSGYKYFGAAKDLPGVKKLQAEWKVEQAEQAAKASKKRKAPKEEAQKEEEKQDTQQNASEQPKEPEVEKPKDQDFADFKAYVDIPTMEDIERLIVKKKKETLLKKYAPSEAQSND
eukprot:s1225_g9.t1